MFDITNSRSASFFNTHKVLSAVVAAGMFAGATTSAMAGDAEITLKLSSSASADLVFGIVDLGGTALVGLEPDEIDVAFAGSGATASGEPAGVVLGTSEAVLTGLTLSGLSPADVPFGRDGLAPLSIESGQIMLEGAVVYGTEGVDETGMERVVSYAATVVLEPVAGALHEVWNASGGEGSVGLDMTFVLADILHKGGSTFRPTNITLKRGVFSASSPIITDLPMVVTPGTAGTEDAGCSPDNICACGGVDSCNTMLAGCFTPGIDGSWDCVKYNDQGQCVLGMCDVN